MMELNEAKNLANFLSSPIAQGVKQFLYQLLGAESFLRHELIIEQISRTIYNDRDYENFGRLMTTIYEAGYLRAIDEHKRELNKLGLKVTIKEIEKKDGPPIFTQKNPADPQ